MTDSPVQKTIVGHLDLGGRIRTFVSIGALPAMPILLLLGFAYVEPKVLSIGNLVNVVQQTAFLFILTVAQMLVLLTRGLDLSLGPCVSMVSVGSTLVMSSVLASDPAAGTQAALLGILAGVAIGCAVGAFNGIVIAYLRVNPFIATIGSMSICLGIATSISSGKPVFGIPEEFTLALYSTSVAGFPIAVMHAVLVALLIAFILHRTVLGRTLYLLGSNQRAVMVAGLPHRRYLALAYFLCSVVAAIGALLLTARTGSGEPNLGGTLSLQTIAAAVIGGVSLAGGKGGIRAVVVGSLFITVLANGMNMVRVDSYIQMLMIGAVLIAAVALDRFTKKTA